MIELFIYAVVNGDWRFSEREVIERGSSRRWSGRDFRLAPQRFGRNGDLPLILHTMLAVIIVLSPRSDYFLKQSRWRLSSAFD
jgi:hypothetical protein